MNRFGWPTRGLKFLPLILDRSLKKTYTDHSHLDTPQMLKCLDKLPHFYPFCPRFPSLCFRRVMLSLFFEGGFPAEGGDGRRGGEAQLCPPRSGLLLGAAHRLPRRPAGPECPAGACTRCDYQVLQ